MKTLKLFVVVFAVLFASVYSEAQPTKKIVKKLYPVITISPFGGAIIPTGTLDETFKPGGQFGLDIGYRANKEVGFYGKFGYYFMSSRITGAPVGKYLEFSAGPRYYFTKQNLKSSLFAEGGVGAYSFSQDSYVSPNQPEAGTIAQISDTKAGVNAGIGANLNLGEDVDILVKGKYNLLFTPNGSNAFVTVIGGLEFKIK